MINTKAAFRAVANVHLEINWRAFFNYGENWAQKCAGKMEWNQHLWMYYHWKWAGFKTYPSIGEYVELVNDGESIIAYGHEDFENLILGFKTFKDTPMKVVTSGSPIGPITQLYPL